MEVVIGYFLRLEIEKLKSSCFALCFFDIFIFKIVKMKKGLYKELLVCARNRDRINEKFTQTVIGEVSGFLNECSGFLAIEDPKKLKIISAIDVYTEQLNQRMLYNFESLKGSIFTYIVASINYALFAKGKTKAEKLESSMRPFYKNKIKFYETFLNNIIVILKNNGVKEGAIALLQNRLSETPQVVAALDS